MEAKLFTCFSLKPSSILQTKTSSNINYSTKHSTLPFINAAANTDSSSSEEVKTSENNNDAPAAKRGTPTPLKIKYRPRSRKQAKEGREMLNRTTPAPKKKDWDSMTLAEKAMELYVGEKGLLYWLNKFAYASIFIIIGGWILFRFVGPSLGLYQLDTPPLSPTSIFKG